MEKLQKGFDVYGDGSFDGPAAETVEELQQECLDLSGWGLILWTKLERIRKAILRIDSECQVPNRPAP